MRQPVLAGAAAFVDAVAATGIPRGDYNGRDRLAAEGVVSLLQTTTRNGKPSTSTRTCSLRPFTFLPAS